MRLLFATCSPAEAEPLLLKLLEEKLVGCGNLVAGATSRYWWDGQIESDEETMMWMETTDELAGAAAERLRELHPYDVPKILVLGCESAAPDYLDWLRAVTR
jgi:periplasmic divalent cation tolerance protein